MKLASKKSFKIIIALFLALVLIFGGLLIWLYSGQLTPDKINVFQNSLLPMAIVNGQPVPMKNFIFKQQLANKITPTAADPQTLIKQTILEEETKQLDSRYGILVTQKQVDMEYQVVQAQPNFNTQLAAAGLNAGSYKDQVLRPKLALLNLQMWFNGQQQGNSVAYNQANDLLKQIEQGGDMPALAASNNQDSTTKSLKGDMGFVQVSDLLPELQETVDSMKPGDVKIIPSRYGLSIIKLEEKVGNSLHLRQIFIPGGDFNSWFNDQIKNFKIKTLI